MIAQHFGLDDRSIERCSVYDFACRVNGSVVVSSNMVSVLQKNLRSDSAAEEN